MDPNRTIPSSSSPIYSPESDGALVLKDDGDLTNSAGDYEDEQQEKKTEPLSMNTAKKTFVLTEEIKSTVYETPDEAIGTQQAVQTEDGTMLAIPTMKFTDDELQLHEAQLKTEKEETSRKEPPVLGYQKRHERPGILAEAQNATVTTPVVLETSERDDQAQGLVRVSRLDTESWGFSPSSHDMAIRQYPDSMTIPSTLDALIPATSPTGQSNHPGLHNNTLITNPVMQIVPQVLMLDDVGSMEDVMDLDKEGVEKASFEKQGKPGAIEDTSPKELATVQESPRTVNVEPPSTPPRARINSSLISSPLASADTESLAVPGKRRRKDMASSINSTLRKPFKSPLKFGGNPNGAKTMLQMVTRTYPDAIKSSPFNEATKPELEQREADVEVLPPPMSSPIKPTFKRIKNSNPPFRSSMASSGSSAIRIKHTALDLTKVKDPELHALQQQHTRLLASVRAAKTVFDNVSQAHKIEQSGEDSRLEALIVKWRGASQQAADHVFGKAADRVNKMGGPRAFKEMQQRGRNSGGWGFNDEQNGSGEFDKCDDNDEDDEYAEERRKRRKEEYEAEYGVEELRMLQEKEKEEEARGGGGGGDDEFTMDMMLKTLNIEHHIIGYDKDSQRWIS